MPATYNPGLHPSELKEMADRAKVPVAGADIGQCEDDRRALLAEVHRLKGLIDEAWDHGYQAAESRASVVLEDEIEAGREEIRKAAIHAFLMRSEDLARKHSADAHTEDVVVAITEFGLTPADFYDDEDGVRFIEAEILRHRADRHERGLA